MRRFDQRRPNQTHQAFTLVELLVVIGIIAILISILLPTLNNARRAANTVKCAANIRTILQGMRLYATRYNDAIPGSAWTSGAFLLTSEANPRINVARFNNNNVPEIVHFNDFVTPIAKVLGISVDDAAGAIPRGKRFDLARREDPFVCPENKFFAVPYPSLSTIDDPSRPFAAGPMVSYNTPLGFMLRNNPTGANSDSSRIGVVWGRTEFNPPPNYNNTLSKIGKPSEKVFVADGARYSNSNTSPDFDVNFAGTYGGPYSDQGAPMRFSNSWDRGRARGNVANQPGPFDGRLFAFRHGTTKPGQAADAYRINLGFFDGHVETLGDLEASNPKFWFPRGTQLTVNATQIQNDTKRQFFNNRDGIYTIE